VRVTSEDGVTINYYRFNVMIKSNNSQLSTLTVGGAAATLGTPGATWNTATTGHVSLSNSLKVDAQLVGTPVYPTATVDYAHVTGAGAPGDFTSNDTYTLADNDYLYVRVTSENGQSVSVYRVQVQIGRDATLQSVTIGGVDAQTLGTPRTSWTNTSWTTAQMGSYQAEARELAEGFTVAVTPSDQDATVQWALSNISVNTEPAYTSASPIVFPSDASDLVIKVVAANTTTVNFYRIRIITKNWAAVAEGTPALDDPAGLADDYIDPIWNAQPWLDVSRFNTAETYSAFFVDYPHTSGQAKALWDENGLWVYWDVDFMDYSVDGGNTFLTRTLVPSAGPAVTPGTTPSNAHLVDSVELFVNERLQTYTIGNYGCQYRCGADNIWLSGDAGNTPAGVNPITIFQQSGMTRAWTKVDGTGKQTGYVVIMQVPWIYKNDANANLVFDGSGNVIPGAEVGMELQINACSANGTRDAILTWNGVTSQAYQNVKSYGIITLNQ